MRTQYLRRDRLGEANPSLSLGADLSQASSSQRFITIKLELGSIQLTKFVSLEEFDSNCLKQRCID